MDSVCHLLLIHFEIGNPCRHKKNLIQAELFQRLVSKRQMGVVDRVKGASKDSNLPSLIHN